MTRRFGYLVEQGPGILRETDTSTCGHCQRVMMVRPSTDGRIIVRVLPPCPGCGKFICDVCVKQGFCDPWEKQMERMEARDRMLREIGVEP
jgi:hypothetical protein